MNKIYSFFLLSIASASLDAQTWQPVGGGTDETIRSLCVFDSALYVGGDFIQAGNTPVLLTAKWDGNDWFAVGNGVPGCTAVQTMIVYNGYLYAGGGMCLCRWNGTSWIAVPGAPSGHIYTLALYNGNLYAGGSGGVHEFNGSNWNTAVFMGDVYALSVYKDELVASGSFNSINGSPFSSIAKWNGTDWSSLGYGILDGTGEDLGVYDNVLYVTGNFNSASGNAGDGFMTWDGFAWSPPVNGADGSYVLDSIDGYFYTGGSYVHQFDGANWIEFGDGFSDYVRDIEIYKNSVYAAGNFTANDSQILLHIARWDQEIGTVSPHLVNSGFNLFPNPAQLQLAAHLSNASTQQTITIYDLQGRKINLPITIENQTAQINTSSLSSGIYLLQISNDQTGEMAAAKFVKE